MNRQSLWVLAGGLVALALGAVYQFHFVPAGKIGAAEMARNAYIVGGVFVASSFILTLFSKKSRGGK